MDNSVKKWMIRAGAFLILFGFFIPSMAVSCSAYGVTQKQSFSMSTAASQMDQGVLYLVLVGVLITLSLSFITSRNSQQRYLFIFGEGGGLALGALSILIAVSSIYSQIQEIGFGALSPSVEPGFFVLIFGYVIAGIGIILELFSPSQNDYIPEVYEDLLDVAPTDMPVHEYIPPSLPMPSPSGAARLELVRGNAPQRVALSSDFSIGRSRQSHCVVNDLRVSRTHVRIREAQGAWFVQDQNSASGTYVNGSRVQAQRLNNGDEIQVGDTVFRFKK